MAALSIAATVGLYGYLLAPLLAGGLRPGPGPAAE